MVTIPLRLMMEESVLHCSLATFWSSTPLLLLLSFHAGGHWREAEDVSSCLISKSSRNSACAHQSPESYGRPSDNFGHWCRAIHSWERVNIRWERWNNAASRRPGQRQRKMQLRHSDPVLANYQKQSTRGNGSHMQMRRPTVGSQKGSRTYMFARLVCPQPILLLEEDSLTKMQVIRLLPVRYSFDSWRIAMQHSSCRR